MMCCCDKCRFVFESIRLLDRCPDCGAESVRQATEEEAAEYAANREKYGTMLVYGISNLFPVKEVEMPFIVGAKNGCPVYEVRRTIVPVVSM